MVKPGDNCAMPKFINGGKFATTIIVHEIRLLNCHSQLVILEVAKSLTGQDYCVTAPF